MKLIDILNKIANGELKEGTKVIWKGKEGWGELEYTYTNGDLERKCCDETIYFYEEIFARHLNDEVELIEPDHFPDVGEMAEPTDNTKIEELDVLEIRDSQNIDNIGLANLIGDLSNEIREIQHKLNEVIRYINKED